MNSKTIPLNSVMKKVSDQDDIFAQAIITRQLWNIPPLLPSTGYNIVQSLQSCIQATRPREKLLLRSLRKSLSYAIQNNDTNIPQLSPLLHQLATTQDSVAGEVAAGLLLLFAHGLGQIAKLPEITNQKSTTFTNKILIIMLGFAGGTLNDIQNYASRIYPATDETEYEVILVTASEIPEIYKASMDIVLRATRGKKWMVHLFSKAGFLMCGRIIDHIVQKKQRQEAIIAETCHCTFSTSTDLPTAVIWDSSPGSLTNYEEFIQGTWASAELIAKRGKFTYSIQARERMNKILHSEQYPYSVRDSYAPMHNLIPFPRCTTTTATATATTSTKHLFLYSEKDPVCAPEEIRKYAKESVTDGKCVVVKGTHCDGLFWSRKIYMDAVKDLLTAVLAEE